MLRKQMEHYVGEKRVSSPIALYKEEKDYVETHSLLEGGIEIVEKDARFRFADAYIERSDKESEELIAIETAAFLAQPVAYLQQHKQEFIYLESPSFELIGVDSICLEMDDLFGGYQALFGLKLQKKFNQAIREYLQANLQGDAPKFALLFNAPDGLWDVNIPLHDIKGFREDLSLEEAYQLIYRFLFALGEAMEGDLNDV